jgi:CelD/BcsL family acetyltransferase involved in cellulose biosynthesis
MSSLTGRDADALLLVVAGDHGWDACLPLLRARRWRRQPLPVLTHWLPQYSYLATPLVDPGAVESATRAIAGFLRDERHAAMLVLDPVDPDTQVTRALWAALAEVSLEPYAYADYERAALRRRPEPTYLEEAASSKRRKDLRRLRRGLARELGAEVEAHDRAGDPAAIEAFLELERDSWKGDEGTAIVQSQADTAFFRRMCAETAAAGRLQVLELRVGDRIAAMQVNVADGGVLFTMKVAFDRALARFSPGALLEVDALQIFHDRTDLDSVDSCAAPDNELLNALWPDRRSMRTVLIPTGAAHAKLVGPGLRAEAGARRVVRAARQARRSVRARRT